MHLSSKVTELSFKGFTLGEWVSQGENR